MPSESKRPVKDLLLFSNKLCFHAFVADILLSISIYFPRRRLMKKECKRLMGVGMPFDMARAVDEKDTKIQRKYEKPILTADEDKEIDNKEYMFELNHYGEVPKTIVG